MARGEIIKAARTMGVVDIELCNEKYIGALKKELYEAAMSNSATEDDMQALNAFAEEKAVLEIEAEQMKTSDVIRKKNDGSIYFTFKPEAIDAIQTASKGYLIDMFARSNMQALHAKRQVVIAKDLQMARRAMSYL